MALANEILFQDAHATFLCMHASPTQYVNAIYQSNVVVILMGLSIQCIMCTENSQAYTRSLVQSNLKVHENTETGYSTNLVMMMYTVTSICLVVA